MSEITKKFFCECCQFNCIRPAEWFRHIESEKHKRMGEKKTTICTICNKELSNHFTLKIHILSAHSTKEDRSQHKYYCDICDLVFVSKLYLDKHISGKRHIILEKTLKSIKEENDKYKQILDLNSKNIEDFII
jgi:hypothetical protein